MNYPQVRLRRLRENPKLRTLLEEHSLLSKDLIQPLFIKESLSGVAEIPSMPGQFQFSPDAVLDEAKSLEAVGISSVILFGIPSKKDLSGRQAFAKKGIVQKAISAIKKKCPRLLVIADVCLCEYLSHGHCGHVQKGRVVNDPTLRTLAKVALSYAQAGADIVAPSDMMDGRVRVIRETLEKNGFEHTPILSYAVKYASGFYSPFRDAAESAPGFGDRSGYQMQYSKSSEALREAQTDLEEGADMLLVKPALAYGDILCRLKDKFLCPVGAYSVSGEYAMVKAASSKGWLDEKKIVVETHTSLKRAGADFIVTYWAKQLMKWRVPR